MFFFVPFAGFYKRKKKIGGCRKRAFPPQKEKVLVIKEATDVTKCNFKRLFQKKFFFHQKILSSVRHEENEFL